MSSREWSSLSSEIKDTITSHQLEVPVRISSLAKALGVEVKAATLPAGISGEIRPNKPRGNHYVVRINRHDPSRRQRFTAAHEIAHFLLHINEIGAGISDDVLYRSSLSDRREAEANRLAADILMPEDLVREALETAKLLKIADVIGYLADRFEVSEAAMRIRLGID
jgi:Zn-dependent peptidase ImmA (M78 family)